MDKFKNALYSLGLSWLFLSGCYDSVEELDTTEKIELGRLLFNDRSLSEPKGVACASCHIKAIAYVGNNRSPIPAVPAGSLPGVVGTRNAPSLNYSAFAPLFQLTERINPATGGTVLLANGGLFWDGRAPDLVEQAKGPLLSSHEMNNPSKQVVVEKVRTGPFAQQFTQIYGPNAFMDAEQAFNYVADAIAAFERTGIEHRFTSKFDAVLLGATQFTQQEALGFQLFKDPEKGNCVGCHAGNVNSREPKDWLFTDEGYANIGVPRNNEIPANRDPNHFDLGLCAQKNLPLYAPSGTDFQHLCGSFKIPTLRNIALTAPYMHNGVIRDLRDTIRFYVQRDTNPERWYSRQGFRGGALPYDDVPFQYQRNVVREAPFSPGPGGVPRLNDAEIEAMVAFLYTLTDQLN